ncbi:hypothetical protein GF327_08630 [Candidatus Woesearchaeota archaeon]|nr:hypothetical protein [Candidatus Woesearchaeota archaeon]
MVTLRQAIILGIIQGITEWLPISSSGHLVLASEFLQLDNSVGFNVFLHLASFFVILFYFRKELFELITGVLNKKKESINYTLYLGIASVPIAVTGFLLNNTLKEMFDSTLSVGISLIITSILLFFSRYPIKKSENISLKNSLVIGFFQAIAIFPGISRSGSTISGAMILGINRKKAARLSFLLAIPAIVGANLLKITEILQLDNFNIVIIGMFTAVTTGYLSLSLLMKIIEKNRFSYFSIYCLILGVITLLFL